MIFVTVGRGMPFDRLVKAVDKLAPTLGEEVFIQFGSSNYKPVNAQCKDFLPFQDAEAMMKKASIIIAHVGIGTIIAVGRIGKPLILVPRWVKGEHFKFDRQAELAKALEGRPGVEVVYDMEKLAGAIKRLKEHPAVLKIDSPGEGIIGAIDEFLETKAGR